MTNTANTATSFTDYPCAGCNAEPGESCRWGCLSRESVTEHECTVCCEPVAAGCIGSCTAPGPVGCCGAATGCGAAVTRRCCGAVTADAGRWSCANCATVAEHDGNVRAADRPCVRCVTGAPEHDYSAPMVDGVGSCVTITTEDYVVESDEQESWSVELDTQTVDLFGLYPTSVLAYVSGVYPTTVETIPGGLRFTDEPHMVDYATGALQCSTVDVVGYSPLTLAVLSARLLH